MSCGGGFRIVKKKCSKIFLNFSYRILWLLRLLRLYYYIYYYASSPISFCSLSNRRISFHNDTTMLQTSNAIIYIDSTSECLRSPIYGVDQREQLGPRNLGTRRVAPVARGRPIVERRIVVYTEEALGSRASRVVGGGSARAW